MADFIPDSQFKPDSAPPAGAPPPSFIPDEQFQSDEDKYGGVGGQIGAGLAGIARGATLGGSDVALVKSGLVSPETLKGQAEQNPITSMAGNIAGGAALIAGTGGLGAAAEAATGGAGLAATALSGAGEGALFGVGNAVSDYALGDPNLNAQKVAADIGLGAILGAGTSSAIHGVIGKFGNAKGSVAETVAEESNSANREAKTADAISKESGLKASAPDVQDAANRLGLPVMHGQISDNPWVQKAEDSLINGAPTYSGLKRAGLYQEGYEGATKALQETLPSDSISKNQLGGVLQDSLATKIDAEAQPFNDLYSTIKEDTQDIPLKGGSAPAIARNILEIPEIKRSFNSPAAQLARDVSEEIGGLENVDDLRAYQTELNGRLSPTAPPAEKRILGLVSDKLDQWEQRSIREHANNFIDGIESRTDIGPEEKQSIWGDKLDRMKTLMSRIDETDKDYSAFRQKLNGLSDWLGKGKVYGAKDAINFIRDRLEPEDLVNKLTSKKYAGLYDYMEKNFPTESAVIKQYQKSALRDAATKNGEFNPKIFLKKVNDLEPEIQKSIFAPDELSKIKDAKTYLDSIPRNFNPSGTAGMNAFREFFKSPTGAAIANARDFAIESFIKTMGALPDNLRPNPYEAGSQMAERLNKFQAVRRIADRTGQQVSENIGNIIYGTAVSSAGNAPKLVAGNYDQKKQRLEELAKNSDLLSGHISNHIDGLDQSLPNVSAAMANHINQSVQFLNSKIPRPKSQLPLSPKWEPSAAQKQKFDRYYDTVNDPISALKQIKHGALTTENMEALQATHPDLLKEMQQKFITMASPDKTKDLPYKVQQSLSLFMGQPLSEGLLPQVRQANQASFSLPQQQGPGAAKGKSPLGGLKELKTASRAQTELYPGEDDQT